MLGLNRVLRVSSRWNWMNRDSKLVGVFLECIDLECLVCAYGVGIPELQHPTSFEEYDRLLEVV